MLSTTASPIRLYDQSHQQFPTRGSGAIQLPERLLRWTPPPILQESCAKSSLYSGTGGDLGRNLQIRFVILR